MEIKYATVDGKSDTFKGNARCYISPANIAVKAGNMTATLGNITGNTTESLNLTDGVMANLMNLRKKYNSLRWARSYGQRTRL